LLDLLILFTSFIDEQTGGQVFTINNSYLSGYEELLEITKMHWANTHYFKCPGRVFDKYFTLSQAGPIQSCTAPPVICHWANQLNFTVCWLQSRVGAEKSGAKVMEI